MDGDKDDDDNNNITRARAPRHVWWLCHSSLFQTVDNEQTKKHRRDDFPFIVLHGFRNSRRSFRRRNGRFARETPCKTRVYACPSNKRAYACMGRTRKVAHLTRTRTSGATIVGAHRKSRTDPPVGKRDRHTYCAIRERFLL